MRAQEAYRVSPYLEFSRFIRLERTLLRIGAARFMTSHDADITVLIERSASGEDAAKDQLFSLLYRELKQRAQQQRRRWHGNLTVNTTALVHESYFKLIGTDRDRYNNRGHFLATASKAMRQVLVDYARRSSAQRRGGDMQRVDTEPEEWIALPEAISAEVMDLHRGLERLENAYPDLARVVECRVFAGLDVKETAECLGIGTATVKRRWAMATSWLESELS